MRRKSLPLIYKTTSDMADEKGMRALAFFLLACRKCYHHKYTKSLNPPHRKYIQDVVGTYLVLTRLQMQIFLNEFFFPFAKGNSVYIRFCLSFASKIGL